MEKSIFRTIKALEGLKSHCTYGNIGEMEMVKLTGCTYTKAGILFVEVKYHHRNVSKFVTLQSLLK